MSEARKKLIEGLKMGYLWAIKEACALLDEPPPAPLPAEVEEAVYHVDSVPPHWIDDDPDKNPHEAVTVRAESVRTILTALRVAQTENARLREELTESQQTVDALSHKHIGDGSACDCYDCTLKILDAEEVRAAALSAENVRLRETIESAYRLCLQTHWDRAAEELEPHRPKKGGA